MNISIFENIVNNSEESQRQNCWPVPYNIVLIQKPVSGGRSGIIPCVELKTVNGDDYQLRRCDDILKPMAKEPIMSYLNRLQDELCKMDVVGKIIQ